MTGGVAGLMGTIILGPRKGRFENPEEFEIHNLPLVVLGTFSLWFGWYGFNPGSTLGMHDGATGAMAAQVAMNTTLSAASGGITVFILKYAITKKYDVGGLCNGILAGASLLKFVVVVVVVDLCGILAFGLEKEQQARTL